MERFSIILPLVGSEAAFEATLASVLRGRPADSQVVVAHTGDYDDPYDLRREVTFAGCDGTASMARLLNAALPTAKHDLIAIVSPGVELLEQWDEPVADAFVDPTVGSVSGPILNRDKPERMITAGVTSGWSQSRCLVGVNVKTNSRRAKKLKPIGPTLWCGFYRRSLLEQVWLLDEQLDECYLDLDIALAARTVAARCEVISDAVATVSGDAILQQAKLPHGKSSQRALIRHGVGDGVGWWTRLLANSVAETLGGSPKHAGTRWLALGSGRADRRFRERLLRDDEASQTLQFETTESNRRRAA